MKAISEDSKTIVFYEENHTVMKLVFTGRFSNKASIIDKNDQVFKIAPVDFWKTKLEVRHNQQCLFTIKKRWNGTAEISTNKDSMSSLLLFKHKGFFRSRYIIQDKDDRELAAVRSKFIRKGFRHDYEFEVSDPLKRKAHYFVLLGIMLYLTRISQRQNTGSAVAIGAAVAVIT